MRFETPVPVATIAAMIGAELKGNIEGMVTGINELHMVSPGDLAL
jgi:UDP-3-O-[3-hydroxymyristoyl] glucosamine N-acyltransferase